MDGIPTSAEVRSKVIADIDFDRLGKQFGHLRVPHAHDESAWGAVPIPIVVIANGIGPTLLLVGGTHGDEYEGQIALLDLARRLEPQEVQGRVIILPAHHFPACLAGTRTSPLDGRDINRAFPGDPAGSFAQVLAHYVANRLVPIADAVMDIHSGGRSLDCLPCTMSHILEDVALTEKIAVFARAFGAPYHIISREVDGSGTFQTTCEARGLIAISSELGGGNRIQLPGLAIAERGIRNLLAFLGICGDNDDRPKDPTQIMLLPDMDCYHFAPTSGIYRPFHPLGAWVKVGEAAGSIYDIADPARAPTVLYFKRSGLLWSTRGQGRIAAGDSCSVVVVPRD
jgi:predicted deacylase